MQTFISKDGDALAQRFADTLVHYAASVLAKQDRFTIALSGGSTPKKLFRLLASPAYKDRIEWNKFHFFWGDERFVPFSDERNNAHMAYDELLNHVPIVASQVHLMRTDLEPDESVLAYEKILHSYFDGKEHSFDLVMLGLGDNAHTLSLFPGYPVVHEQDHWVSAFYLDEQSMHRITLTSPIVNQSAVVAFLVAGGDKALAVKEVIKGEPNPDQYPAQVIRPVSDKLYWFLDEAAAVGLIPPKD